MSRWQQYLFGPVAALRPRLFAQLFLAVMALDIWLNFVQRGPNLGVGGFVVAHFQWLDDLQPVPTPALYIGMMIVTSFSLWVAALCGGHRLLIALGTLLFTYGWTMSQTDSFQHHYLMSLILLCVTLFPTNLAANVSIGDRRPLLSAWAYVMLGTQVGIVYFWTVVTKFDADWLRGDVVERLTDNPSAHPLLLGGANLYRTITGGNPWPMMAFVTILMEVSLAVGYLYAVGQDRRGSRLSRFICIGLWILTIILHGGILLMPLSIGLFGYYMLVVGSIFLLPIPWLELIERFVIHPIRRVAGALSRRMNPGQSKTLCLAETLVVATGLFVIGLAIDLPGSLTACGISAAILIAYTSLDVRGNRVVAAQQRVLASVLFIALAASLVFGSTLRERVDMRMAYMQHIAGDPLMALRYYTRAVRQTKSPEAQSGVLNNIGDLMCRMHDYAEAVEWYRTALARDPNNGSCRANLALALMSLHKYEEAAEEYNRALELKFTSPTVHYNFAFALQNLNRSDEAITQYRMAVLQDPDMLAAHNNLAVLLLTANQLDEAHHHLREVLRLDPEDVFTMNNLAWLLATKPGRSPEEAQEALTIAIRATTLTKREHPVVLGTLAECYFAMGMRQDAANIAEEAINLARDQKQENVAAQVRSRLERYRQ